MYLCVYKCNLIVNVKELCLWDTELSAIVSPKSLNHTQSLLFKDATNTHQGRFSTTFSALLPLEQLFTHSGSQPLLYHLFITFLSQTILLKSLFSLLSLQCTGLSCSCPLIWLLHWWAWQAYHHCNREYVEVNPSPRELWSHASVQKHHVCPYQCA